MWIIYIQSVIIVPIALGISLMIRMHLMALGCGEVACVVGMTVLRMLM